VELLVANAHAADAVDVVGAAFGVAVAARGTPVAHHCQHIVTLATIIISLARSIGTLPSTLFIICTTNPCCCGSCVLPARACDRDAKPPHAHTFPRIDLNPRHVLSFSRLILPVKRTATTTKKLDLVLNFGVCSTT
jgi:hypothetical protein